jgi:excisionase family DNA binding protein
MRARRLLRTRQAAEYLGLSKDTILAMARSGELPFIQRTPDSPFLFDVKDLDRWIEDAKQ